MGLLLSEYYYIPGHAGDSGELFVRGDNMFKEYWQRPEATQETFTSDGWFRTGMWYYLFYHPLQLIQFGTANPCT